VSKPTWPKAASSAMARLQLASGDVVDIESGPHVETKYEYIYSDRATIADMTWEQEHGDHAHRFTGKPRKAEVTEAVRGSKHIDCDGGECGGVCGGEGYEVSAWFCLHDGSEVEARYVPDVEARVSGIPVRATHTYSMTLRGFPPYEPIEGATLVRGDGSATDLPPMAPGNMRYSSEDDEPTIEYSGMMITAVDA
jgi:hypothetical protein